VTATTDYETVWVPADSCAHLVQGIVDLTGNRWEPSALEALDVCGRAAQMQHGATEWELPAGALWLLRQASDATLVYNLSTDVAGGHPAVIAEGVIDAALAHQAPRTVAALQALAAASDAVELAALMDEEDRP
jgi:hypothetical protein